VAATNALAYRTSGLITAVKGFVAQAWTLSKMDQLKIGIFPKKIFLSIFKNSLKKICIQGPIL